jgi:hypothetical protein
MDQNDISVIKAIVEKSFKREVGKAVDAIIDASRKVTDQQRSFFRDTEKILYSYPTLKLKVMQDEEDIKNDQIHLPEKSKDIVRFSATRSFRDNDMEDILKRRIESMERTKKEIHRVDMALESIKDDRYFDIIPLRYWDLVQPSKIAEALGCDERTYRRNKNRLITKLKLVLFGADALYSD